MQVDRTVVIDAIETINTFLSRADPREPARSWYVARDALDGLKAAVERDQAAQSEDKNNGKR
jgi:hypothetical protein